MTTNNKGFQKTQEADRQTQANGSVAQETSPEPNQAAPLDSDVLNLRTGLNSQIGTVEEFANDIKTAALANAQQQAAEMLSVVVNYPEIVAAYVNQGLNTALFEGRLGKSLNRPSLKASNDCSTEVAKLLESAKGINTPEVQARMKALPSGNS